MLKTYEIIWSHNLAKSMQKFVGWGKGEKLDSPPPTTTTNISKISRLCGAPSSCLFCWTLISIFKELESYYVEKPYDTLHFNV